MVGLSADWSRLDEFLLTYMVEASMIPTVLASSFAASLELAREGRDRVAPAGRIRAAVPASAPCGA